MSKLAGGLIAIGAGALLVSSDGGAAASALEAVQYETAQQSGRASLRRLTPDQYRNVIDDIFGSSIELGGRFEPDQRVDNLNEIGASSVSVSSAGMAQYYSIARSVATHVVSEEHRNALIPCQPKSAMDADDACASQFLSKAGGMIFRRPLTAAEQRRYVEAARTASKTTKDFYTGLSLSLTAMLSSPQFLFRQVVLEPDPASPGNYRLDGYSKASRVSFLLWNSMPDPMLLAAAERGDLHTQKGLAREASRMLASPRLEDGVRAFFADMFQFDAMSSLSKDGKLYPKFNSMVVADAQEQTLKTLIDLLVRQREDYPKVFVVRKTYLTPALASVYDLPLINNVPNGSPDAWQPYEFPANDPRGGILTHLSFLALHSHPGRSSPTLRGKALREIMLCQKVPAPPGDVDFTLVNDDTAYKTARERLAAHSREPMCAGCHKITDPMGLALENFDGAGAYRTEENGKRIDTTGEFEGTRFNNGRELGQVFYDKPERATSCLVDRLTAYALGRTPVRGEATWLGQLKEGFASNGYKLPDLMRDIATSPELYRVSAPVVEASDLSAGSRTTR